MNRSGLSACAALVAALSLAGCSGGGSSSAPAIATAPGSTPSSAPTVLGSPAPTPTGTFTPGTTTRYRLLLGEYLTRSLAADPVARPLLDGTSPIVILTGQDPPFDVSQPFAPPAWNASYMIRFTSEADLASVIASHGIPSFVTWIMYDNEPATLPPTPATELPPNDPAPFYAAAGPLVHAAGMRFAATAGLSGTSQQQQDVFDTATSWDLYGVQSQTGELDLTQFDRNIANTMASVWAVNPTVAFSAGVGDYANGGLALAPAIVPAMASVPANALVWMNFGPHPDGVAERDDIAIQVLEDTTLLPRAAPLPTP